MTRRGERRSTQMNVLVPRSAAMTVLLALCLFISLAFPYSFAFADECPAGGEHDYVIEVDTPATEDTDGLEYLVCTKCGDTVARTIPATGHVWGDWTVTTEPTCTSEGEEYRVCTKCGNTEYQTIPALSSTGEHTYVETARVEPTCTEDGSVTYTCSVCGNVRNDVLSALGHDWGDWTVVTEPTATGEGLEQRVCKRDPSHVETQAIPATGVPTAPAQDETQTSVTDDSGSSSKALPSSFFTAGPDRVDAVILGGDIIVFIVAGFICIPLAVQLAWLRRKRREARITAAHTRSVRENRASDGRRVDDGKRIGDGKRSGGASDSGGGIRR